MIIAHSLALQTGDTALHLACREKGLEAAKWLMEEMSREAALGLNQVRGSCGYYSTTGNSHVAK